MDIKANILGSVWTVKFIQKEEDEMFMSGKCDGYCDHSTRTIAIMEDPGDSEIDNYEPYLQNNLRHELIHAFFYESGLGCNWEHPHQWGHDETTVDWFALQIPKIEKTHREILKERLCKVEVHD